jgi:hypothetical protein
MMGLVTKQDGQIIVESNGVDEGTQRRFNICFGTNVFNAMKDGQMHFDIENASATKPAQIVGLTDNATPATYGPEVTQYIARPITIDTPAAGGIFDPLYTIALATVRQWIYSTDAALSPATRKYRIYIRRPETIQYIGLIPNAVNNQSKSNTNNLATGTLTLALHNFLSLKHLRIVESWISTLNLGVDELQNLETFMLTEHPNLATINGKLPTCTKYIILGELNLITNINTLLSKCTQAEGFYGGTYSPSPGLANALTTLTGTLEIAHMTNLKEFGLLGNTGITGINFPTIPANQWRVFQMRGASGVQYLTNAMLLNALQSTSLVYFDIQNGNKSWAQSIGNSEFPNTLLGLNLSDNLMVGDITITAARLAVKSIILGQNQNEGNDFENIDISGLSGGALTTWQANGVKCDNLTLPASLPSLTSFQMFDNELDQGTNNDLVTKINAYTALTELYLSNFSTSALSTNHFGQVSTNGIGNNPDFSGLVNCVDLFLANCKAAGTLTLANVNKIVRLSVAFNTGLTAFANLTAHTTLTQLVAHGCTALVFAITNVFTALNNIRVSSTKVTSIDLTGKTTTSGGLTVVIDAAPDITEIKFPTTQARALIATASGQVIQITNCPSLTSLVNLDQLNWQTTGATNNQLTLTGNALNQFLPIGSNNCIPSTILCANNGISAANMDATLINMAQNADKWDVYSVSKVFTGNGTNAAPTGVYAPPATPGVYANGREAQYYLTVTKGWTINVN